MQTVEIEGYAGNPIHSLSDWEAHAMPADRKRKHWTPGRSAGELGRVWTANGEPETPMELTQFSNRPLEESARCHTTFRCSSGKSEPTALPYARVTQRVRFTRHGRHCNVQCSTVSFAFPHVLCWPVLLIAATAAEYTVQYFLASPTSESRMTPPNSTRTAG